MIGSRMGPAVRPAQPILPGLAVVFCLTLVALAVSAIVYSQRELLFTTGTSAVYFTPGDPTTKAVVQLLDEAKQTVRVQAYSFTSAPIAKALVDAKRRGVDVIAILDKSNVTAQYSSADFLAHEGVPTYIDSKHAIAHNKIMIIDGESVITGSFNFTKAAQENNAENLIVLRDAKLAEEYEQNWQIHLAHSKPYPGR
jgi:phosphatidylserine/phosphatidylglycerophosphate/cardiolipin synthase-like enzyme